MSELSKSLHVDAVEGLDPDMPVVMLNLMKFRNQSLDGDGTGWDAYRRYSAHIIPLLKGRGGTVLWAGEAGAVAFGPAADGDWDYVSLIWYPTPGAFLDMLASADYAVGNVHRENGTERHTIIANREDYSKFN
ncbi:MAG: hypothetical protein ACI8TP_004137 [Acidimicrobiales bacterium]|jgi:uncharacterized protein (DUF1330 family)